jgi:hypothetical protein
VTARVERLAGLLTALSDRPEHAGKTWTWESIAAVLDCPVGVAHQVITYLRQNATDRWWTVGTASTGFTMVPTTSLMDALDDTLNQYKHLRTRVFSQHRKMTVLATVDPEPRMARIANREARFWRRVMEDLDEHLEAMEDLRPAMDESVPAA